MENWLIPLVMVYFTSLASTDLDNGEGFCYTQHIQMTMASKGYLQLKAGSGPWWVGG